MGAPSCPVWSAAGLDPIPSSVATYNYSSSSDYNICSRTRVAIINNIYITMQQERNYEKPTVTGGCI